MHVQIGDLRSLKFRDLERCSLTFCFVAVPADWKPEDNGNLRLDAIQEFSALGAGFQLAQRDLEIRGAGTILGADQSGDVNSVGFELYTEVGTVQY